MTNFKNIVDFVTHEATEEQIQHLILALKYRRETISRQNRFTFNAGQKVCFTGRDGRTITGTIEKIAVKKAHVKAPGRSEGTNVMWNVPLNMLKAA